MKKIARKIMAVICMVMPMTVWAAYTNENATRTAIPADFNLSNCNITGNAKIENDGHIGSIKNGDVATYMISVTEAGDYVVVLDAKKQNTGNSITVAIGSATATVTLKDNGVQQLYYCKISGVQAGEEQDLTLTFNGGGSWIADVYAMSVKTIDGAKSALTLPGDMPNVFADLSGNCKIENDGHIGSIKNNDTATYTFSSDKACDMILVINAKKQASGERLEVKLNDGEVQTITLDGDAAKDFYAKMTGVKAGENSLLVKFCGGGSWIADVYSLKAVIGYFASEFDQTKYTALNNCKWDNTKGFDSARNGSWGEYTLCSPEAAEYTLGFDAWQLRGGTVTITDASNNTVFTSKTLIAGNVQANKTHFTENVTLPAGISKLRFALSSSENWAGNIANITLTAGSATTVGRTVTVGSTGYATLYLNHEVSIPTGVTAFTAELDETQDLLTLKTVAGTVIPANTAVILKATAGDYVFSDSNTGAAAIEGNDLKGWAQNKIPTATDAAGTGNELYGLGDVSGDVCFCKYTSANIILNKAYIVLPAASQAKQLAFRFDETPTGITSVNTLPASRSTRFSLSGQQVGSTYRGITIINGKKYVK